MPTTLAAAWHPPADAWATTRVGRFGTRARPRPTSTALRARVDRRPGLVLGRRRRPPRHPVLHARTSDVLDDRGRHPVDHVVHRRPHQPGRRLLRPLGRRHPRRRGRSCGRARRATTRTWTYAELRAQADGLAHAARGTRASARATPSASSCRCSPRRSPPCWRWPSSARCSCPCSPATAPRRCGCASRTPRPSP